MHDKVIMHGCIIVFLLESIIIQQGVLFQNGLLVLVILWFGIGVQLMIKSRVTL